MRRRIRESPRFWMLPWKLPNITTGSAIRLVTPRPFFGASSLHFFDANASISILRVAFLKQTAAIKAYETAAKKAISTGQKIDVTLQLVLCGFLFSNEKIIKTNLEKANRLL